MQEIVLFSDIIKCPECGKVQDAEVTYFPEWPWHPVYVHECEECGYIITESDWYSLKRRMTDE